MFGSRKGFQPRPPPPPKQRKAPAADPAPPPPNVPKVTRMMEM